MEKEENQNNPSLDQNQDIAKESEKPEESIFLISRCLNKKLINC